MKIEERLAHLLEHGIGCPQAVKLGGETAVAAWCEQEELTLEATLAEAEARVAEAIAKATEPVEITTAGDAEPEDATLGPEPGTAAAIVEDQKAIARQLGAILDRVDILEGTTDRLQEAVDALAVEPEPEAKPKGRKAGKAK